MKSPRTLLLADLFLQGLLSLFKSMAVASVGIIALMFFFNYGKPYDWFHSPVIAACSVIAPLLLGAFLWRMTDPPKRKFYITSSTLNTRFLINVLKAAVEIPLSHFGGNVLLFHIFCNPIFRCRPLRPV